MSNIIQKYTPWEILKATFFEIEANSVEKFLKIFKKIFNLTFNLKIFNLT